MQKRLIRKLDLEKLLSQVGPHPSPKAPLEQYTITADAAATMLYVAAYTYHDIAGKSVLDLGCGTGRLALGAAFLGAKNVVGVDVDKTAIRMAFENSRKFQLKNIVQWIVADIDTVHGRFDTVLQNPPFGVQKRKADRKFLLKALETGVTIFSFHKSPRRNRQLTKKLESGRTIPIEVSPSDFLKSFIEVHGGKINAVYSMPMMIPHMFHFHRKQKHKVIVDLYVIEGKGRSASAHQAKIANCETD